MEHVKKYPNDYSKPLVFLMKYLAIANIVFFNKDKTFVERNWRYLYLTPLIALHVFAMSIYLTNVLIQGKDVFEDAFMIPIFVVTIQAILKAIIVACNKREFENIIDELGVIWRTDKLNNIQKAVKKSSERELRFAGIAYLRFPYVVAWQYLLLPIMETLIHNVILKENDEKLLPFNSMYPYDPTRNWIIYGMTYVYQVYCMFIIVYLYLSTDFLFVTLSAHLSVEFMLLQEDLLHIKPTKEVDYSVPRCVRNGCIRDFVRNHQRLIIISQKLDGAVNKLTFINLLFTTINLSFFGLAAIAARSVADKLVNLIVVVNVMLLVYIMCYFCERLKAASEEIFNVASKNLWYEGDKDYKTIIYFIMLRSQKPCYITSLKYTPITLQTFTKVLSTTWSYFSLVNTMFQHRQ